MPGAWDDPVAEVGRVLRDAGVDATVEELQSPAATARAAAEALGCDLDQIVKSLLLVCDGAFVMALVPGDARADLDAVAGVLGASDVRVGKPDEVVAGTGFEPGGVAPFPHRSVATVLMDSALLARPRVWIGAGTEFHMAALSPYDLQRLTGARAVDLGDAG
jgi:prolyl-tRNA editing enzyme YbaK/EbsC (Cys-tRNA(Pro) deacylase)